MTRNVKTGPLAQPGPDSTTATAKTLIDVHIAPPMSDVPMRDCQPDEPIDPYGRNRHRHCAICCVCLSAAMCTSGEWFVCSQACANKLTPTSRVSSETREAAPPHPWLDRLCEALKRADRDELRRQLGFNAAIAGHSVEAGDIDAKTATIALLRAAQQAGMQLADALLIIERELPRVARAETL